MTKKQRRRAPHSKSARGKLSPETLERKARDDLAGGRHREAIAGFKQLLKLEPRAGWRAALADAYAGRARELTAKGMLKEALVIWENRAGLGEGLAFEPDQAELLLRMDRVEAVIALLSDKDAVPPADRNRLRSLLAARHLAGEEMVTAGLPADDPVVLHAEMASAALAAYCAGDESALGKALAAIPFRSPYRDWVQILKALQHLPDRPREAAGLLDRVTEDSAFSRLGRAAQLALLSESAFLASIPDTDKGSVRFACVLRGWPEERISLREELDRLGSSPQPLKLLRFMYGHRKALGEDWTRRRGLRLLIAGYPASRDWLASVGAHSADPEETLLLAAWDAEKREDLWDQQALWERYAHHLIQEAGDDSAGTEPNLRIALALRRCERANNILSNTPTSDDPDDFGRVVANTLEQSLARDPGDRETYLRLIRYYRRGKRFKDVRRLLEQARDRWPEDMQIFEAALDTALDTGSFKKAAGLAREMLALDPINSGVRERLVEAHLSHARKQIVKGRPDLARKELANAGDWARGGPARDRLDLTAGLIALLENAETGAPALRGMIDRCGGGLAGRLALALEGEALKIPPQKLFKEIELDKPSAARRDDLLATFARLRTHIDGGGKIGRELAAYCSKALMDARWKDLSRGETEAACETLRRAGLDKVLLRLTRAALKRWRAEPVFELHAFEAKYAKGSNAPSDNDVWRLESALHRARDEGDTRTAVRIKQVLAGLNPFAVGPLSPLPPPETEFFDPGADVEAITVLIEMLGLDRALNTLGVPPEAKGEIKRLARESGNGAVAEALAALAGMLFGPDGDDEPPPTPRPPPRRSATTSKREKPKRRSIDDSERDGGLPDQLDLF
jgi:tetratricopeptide (TPR) repeat protein